MTPDPDEFARLYDRLFPKVYTFLVYALADAGAADDAAAATFERAYAKWDSFDPARGPVDAWLFGIARHAATDQQRSRRRWGWLPAEWWDARPAPEPRVEDRLAEDESRRELVKALAVLDDRERAILALKYGAGMKNVDIAAQENLSASLVGVVVHNAVKKLRRALAGEKS